MTDSIRAIGVQFQNPQTDRAEPSRIFVIPTFLRAMVIDRTEAEPVLLNHVRTRVRMTDRTHPFATIATIEAVHLSRTPYPLQSLHRYLIRATIALRPGSMGHHEIPVVIPTDTDPVVPTRVSAIGYLSDLELGDLLVDGTVAFRHQDNPLIILYFIDNLVIVLS